MKLGSQFYIKKWKHAEAGDFVDECLHLCTGRACHWDVAGERHFLESDQAMQSRRQRLKSATRELLFDVARDYCVWLIVGEHSTYGYGLPGHLFRAFDQVLGLDGFDYIARGKLAWDQNKIGAADRKDGRLHGSAGGVDHEEVVMFGKLIRERNDLRLIQLGMGRDWVTLKGAHPIREGVVVVGINGSDLVATAADTAGNDGGKGGLPCPAFAAGDRDDAHGSAPYPLGSWLPCIMIRHEASKQ